MDKRPKKFYILFISVVLILVTLSVFWQVRSHEFISFDDNMYIYNNSQVTAGLTRESLAWAFTTTHAFNWHPLTWMSHMLDCELYGLDAGGHHFTNVLFHIANTVLLLLVLNRMTRNLWPSVFVAAAFALHPLHVESVAWASERKDVLSTFFWMLTMWAYVRYVERREIKRYIVIILVFTLGLMAKQMLVTLPFVLLLLDYWPLGRLKFEKQCFRNSARECIVEKLPLLLLSAVAGIVIYLVQHAVDIVKSTKDYPLSARITNALAAYITYIGKMLWPTRLAIFYPHPGKDLPVWQSVGAALLLVLITAAIFWKIRRRPYLAVGWLWYLGTLVPVIGLVQIGLQALADRYTYIPLIGLFMIIAWGTADILARLRYRKVVLSITGLLLLLIMAVMSWFQVSYWRNGMTLYGHGTEVVPNNTWTRYYLGEELVLRGRLDEAIKHFKESLRIEPDCAYTKYFLGSVLLRQGKIDEAIKVYEELLPKLPDNIAAADMPDVKLVRKGKLGEIINLYTKGHVNLGIALSQQGKLDEAIKHYTEALRIRPDFAVAHTNLGHALARQGKLEEAITHYAEALHLNPTSTEAHYYLAYVLYEQGKINEAITFAEKALVLAESSNQKKIAEEIRKSLRLYKDKADAPSIESSAK
ncbi:MAG: tetratricopeptide repeat protein [Planctomycetota bacterium]|nr:MAG: tetratricopeptide repeat protein [Planctomycetota bacterium]